MDRQEVMNSDEVKHCPVCGEPIETVVVIPKMDGSGTGTKMKFGISCKCEREKEQKRAEEEEKRKDMQIVNELRRLSLMDEKLKTAQLSSFIKREDNVKLLKIVVNYINNFDRMYKENQGLLLWGEVGTGKSYAAAVIANELLNRKISVVMTSFVKILKEADPFKRNDDRLNKLNQAKLLVIDDLGTERSTDYALEKVYDVVDSRYRSNKPIIITTNLSLEQMKTCTDIRYSRIYDRVFEMCYPVQVKGISWRKREAAARFDTVRKILEG